MQHVELAGEVLDLVIGHHEKLDGSGYPYGLEGEQISIFARIGAVADVFDALTTSRPYKEALTVERAVRLLKRDVKNGHLDERVVLSLIRALPVWEGRLRSDPSLKGFYLPEQEQFKETKRGMAV